MKLRQLVIDRLPGITERISLDALGDGVQIVTGPNGIGKSSLCRALRALLWREHKPEAFMAAHAVFALKDQHLRVERDGSRHRWQRDGADTDPPALPGAHLDGCFFLALRDLIEPSPHAGDDLAARIRLRMSGGFDIGAAREKLFGHIGPRYGRSELKALDDAERELSQTIAGQAQLERDQAQLSTLRQSLEKSIQAARRLGPFGDAIDLATVRRQHERIQAELEALPAACRDLTGNEQGELEAREKELENKRDQQQAVAGALKKALQDAESTRLDTPIDPARLAEWRQRAAALVTLEMQIDNAKESLAGLRGKLAAAQRAVGAGAAGALEIDIIGAAQLFSFLRDATRLRTLYESLSERIKLLDGIEFSSAQRQRLELLQAGIASLRSWLRAPEPARAGNSAEQKRRRTLYWLTAVLVAGGAVLAYTISALFSIVIGAGLGIGLAAWWLAPGPGSSEAREVARHNFPADIDPPTAWSVTAVEARLRELEGDAAQLQGFEKNAGIATADRARIEVQCADLRGKLDAIEERRQTLADQLGLQQIPHDAELVDSARAFDQLRTAVQAERQGAESLADMTARYDARLAELCANMVQYGEPESADAVALQAAHGNLEERSRRLREAREREAGARDGAGRLDQDVARITAAIADIYRRCGLESGDRGGLQRLLDGLARYREVDAECERQKIEIRILSGKLASAGEGDLERLDVIGLETQQRRLEGSASQGEELRSRRAKIEAEIGRARERHDVAEAIAGRDQRRAHLAQCRDEALRAAAGRFLLDVVKREHESKQMPQVLERARELFARFTHHSYDLQVAPDASGSFRAVDMRSGEVLRPDQLSDGSRVQLILAARLAFAHQAEGSTQLPLFLDEALDQSDPDRFEAIARSLGRIAEDEDRQIFYLTSDPGDAARIQEALSAEGCKPAGIIDLAVVRGRQARITEPRVLRVAQPKAVPDPAGMTPETYAVALGVTALKPAAGAGAQHLFHLAWDDLTLLHRLLANQVESVGQWSLLSRNHAPLAERIRAESGIGVQLDDRVQLLEAFCLAWLEGRGQPVTREAIEASGAVSGRYLDPVAEIAGELDGDAARLMAVISARGDARLSGFYTSATEKLQAWLEEQAYLDLRPILSRTDLTTRLLMTPAADRLPEAVFSACVHRWWQLSG